MNAKAFWEDQNISNQVEWRRHYIRHRELLHKIETQRKPINKGNLDRKLLNNVTRGRIFKEQTRQTEILKGNKLLVDKICEINEHSEKKWRALTSPYRNEESLNIVVRKKRACNIAKENVALVDRILSVKPNLDTSRFEKEFRRHNKHKKMITRYNRDKMKLMQSLSKRTYASNSSLIFPQTQQMIAKSSNGTAEEDNELAISTLTQTLELNFDDSYGDRSEDNHPFITGSEKETDVDSGEDDLESNCITDDSSNHDRPDCEEYSDEEEIECEGVDDEYLYEYEDDNTYQSGYTTMTENESFILDAETQEKQLTALMSMPSQLD